MISKSDLLLTNIFILFAVSTLMNFFSNGVVTIKYIDNSLNIPNYNNSVLPFVDNPKNRIDKSIYDYKINLTGQILKVPYANFFLFFILFPIFNIYWGIKAYFQGYLRFTKPYKIKYIS